MELTLKASKDNTMDAHVGHSLTQGRVTIGRDKSNDLVLAAESVSGFHAALIVEGGSCALIDLGSTNGTYVNGERLSGKKELKAWDLIRFGHQEFELVDPAGRRATKVQPVISDAVIESKTLAADKQPRNAKPLVDAAAGHLLCTSPEGPAKIVLQSQISVGRAPDNTVVLGVTTISANHARITVEKDSVTVTDLGSSNGTFVNGKPIQQSAIKHGDELAFDTVKYRVVMYKQADEPAQLAKTKVRAAISDTQLNPSVAAAAALGADANATRLETPSIASGVNTAPSGRASADVNATRQQSAYKVPPPPPPPQRNQHAGATNAYPWQPAQTTSWMLYSFKGRLTRQPFIIANIVIGLLLLLSNDLFIEAGLRRQHLTFFSLFLVNIFLIWAYLAVSAKRFHDLNHSAWLLLLNLIPYAGYFIVLIYGGLVKGVEYDNQYGPNPYTEDG